MSIFFRRLNSSWHGNWLATLLLAALVAGSGLAASQVPLPNEVRPIAPPQNPLPTETASAGVTQFSFVVYGDTRGRRDGSELQYEHSLIVNSMLEVIKKQRQTDFPVRFVLQTGDAVVNGGDPKQWNVSFVSLVARLTMEGGVPYFLAPGNHDVTAAQDLNSPDRRKGLQNYLAAVANLIPPDGAERRLDGYPCYGFGYGNSFFLALDSNIADDEAQFQWVRKQLNGLDRTRYRNVFAFFHHPAYSSGLHGGAIVEPPIIALRQRYMPLFRAHQVRAIFAGHEHLFEHWVERYVDASGQAHRLDQVVTGGGGAPLYTYQGEPDLRDYSKKYESEKVRVEHLVRPGAEPGSNPYHFLLVKVDGERISLELIGVDWGIGFSPYRSNKAQLAD